MREGPITFKIKNPFGIGKWAFFFQVEAQKADRIPSGSSHVSNHITVTLPPISLCRRKWDPNNEKGLSIAEKTVYPNAFLANPTVTNRQSFSSFFLKSSARPRVQSMTVAAAATAHSKKLMKLTLSLFGNGFNSSKWYPTFSLKTKKRRFFFSILGFLFFIFVLFLLLFIQQNGCQNGGCKDKAAQEQETSSGETDEARHRLTSSVWSRCHRPHSSIHFVLLFSSPLKALHHYIYRFKSPPIYLCLLCFYIGNGCVG